MKEITSINNDYIKNIVKLKEKKYRTLNKKFIVEGVHLVREAYLKHKLLTVLTTSNINIDVNDIEFIKVTDKIIEKLSSTKNPQNVIGICKMDNDTFITGSKFLLLDNINDPGNLGTLIRSSLAFGVDAIILSNDSVDCYNDKVIRATQGAIFKQKIIYTNLLDAIQTLKDMGVYILGTSLKSSIPLQNVRKKDKYAIILGNEANGISDEILKETNQNIIIEMNKDLESLNVSVAGSIIMYYLNTKEE